MEISEAGNPDELIFCSRGNSDTSSPGAILITARESCEEQTPAPTKGNLSERYEQKFLLQAHFNVQSAAAIKNPLLFIRARNLSGRHGSIWPLK